MVRRAETQPKPTGTVMDSVTPAGTAGLKRHIPGYLDISRYGSEVAQTRLLGLVTAPAPGHGPGRRNRNGRRNGYSNRMFC